MLQFFAFAALSLLISASAMAAECPDLSGAYRCTVPGSPGKLGDLILRVDGRQIEVSTMFNKLGTPVSLARRATYETAEGTIITEAECTAESIKLSFSGTVLNGKSTSRYVKTPLGLLLILDSGETRTCTRKKVQEQ